MDRTRGIHMVLPVELYAQSRHSPGLVELYAAGTAFTFQVELHVQGWHSPKVRSFTPHPTPVYFTRLRKRRAGGKWTKG